jgi:signal peptidase
MKFGKFIKLLSDLIFYTGLAVAGIFLVLHFKGIKPFSFFVVTSGSMEPAIHTGSIVIVTPQKNYSLGDVVTFYSGANKKNTSTHRIVGINDKLIRTLGDANEEPDPSLTTLDNIVGKVLFSIPLLGYLAAFAKTPKGFILLVIVPATIVIYEELKGLFFEAKGFIKKKSSPKPSSSDSPFKPVVLLPVFFASLVFGSLTVSYFIDHETSAGNVLARSAPTITPSSTPTPSTPTPTPNPGEPFVDSVASVTGTFGHCCDTNDLSSSALVAASLITGAPDSPPAQNFIQLSDNAVLTASFDNNKAVDGSGTDIRIHIYDNQFPGSALIEVSSDCNTYSTAGIHDDTVDVDVDLSSVVPSLTQVQCVRITDLVDPNDPFPTLGFDLDAIEAINSISTP